MIDVSIQIESWVGLDWPRWKRIVDTVDTSGFAGLFSCDHFAIQVPSVPVPDTLDPILALAYAADHTEHVHIGPLVAPVSFRDPIVLARQFAGLDDLTGGRMVLGLGAGWNVYEHEMYGYQLGDLKSRMDRFEEALTVISGLLRATEPLTFSGRYFSASEATLRPLPARPGGPRLMVGGKGPRRTLPLAARFADIWNTGFASPEEFARLSGLLDTLLLQAGRDPRSVKRTLMLPFAVGRTDAELEFWLRGTRAAKKEAANASLDSLLQDIRDGHGPVGSPEEVAAALRSFERAGCEEVMLQCLTTDGVEGIELVASEVLPLLRG